MPSTVYRFTVSVVPVVAVGKMPMLLYTPVAHTFTIGDAVLEKLVCSLISTTIKHESMKLPIEAFHQ